jgi:type II secretory pathway pseudopilin PulG
MTPSFSPTRSANQPALLAGPSPQLCELGRQQPATEKVSRQRKAIPASEQGYVMLIAIFFMALLMISLTVAAPKIARSIQRDRDLETFHRGMQYRRAIQLYYRKMNHTYPPNVEALINTNDIRFLRKKYKDPITGQDDWKPIAFGQNKTPTAMGFFGQPLAGNASTLAGIGPGGAGGLPGAATPGSAFGGSSSGSGIFGSSDSGSGQSPAAGGSSPTDNSGSSAGTSSGTTGSTGSTTSGGTSSTGTGTGTSSSPGGPTFGGAGIIGFSPASPNASILVYKKKQHYNEWEFTYDPLSDMQTVGGGNTGQIGQPASSTTTPVGAPTFGAGTSGPGSNPGSSTMPPETTPQ